MTAWTREKPTKPGWYWSRADATDRHHTMLKVVPALEGLVAQWVYGAAVPVEAVAGEWQGPIEPEV